MDIFNKNKNEKDENKTKKVVKRHMLVATVILAVKIFLMLLMIFAVVAVIEWLVKIFQPKNTVDKIYEKLQIDNVGELVQIKGNENDGYYLVVKSGGVECLGENANPYDMEAYEKAQALAGAFSTLLRNAGGTLHTVAYGQEAYQKSHRNISL